MFTVPHVFTHFHIYTTVLWQQDLVFKERNAFIQQGYIKYIQNDTKDIYNVTNDFCYK